MQNETHSANLKGRVSMKNSLSNDGACPAACDASLAHLPERCSLESTLLLTPASGIWARQAPSHESNYCRQRTTLHSYILSLHDALPISLTPPFVSSLRTPQSRETGGQARKLRRNGLND